MLLTCWEITFPVMNDITSAGKLLFLVSRAHPLWGARAWSVVVDL